MGDVIFWTFVVVGVLLNAFYVLALILASRYGMEELELTTGWFLKNGAMTLVLDILMVISLFKFFGLEIL